MSIEEMFEDFKMIQKMNAPDKFKAGMLTYLFAADPERWRVVGITKNALLKLKESDFKRTPRMGLNRSHKHGRNDIYCQMLSMDFANSKEWWTFYYNHDETILATSSENISGNIKEIDIFPINPVDGLFKSVGYGWSHRKTEQAHLKELYETFQKDLVFAAVPS